MEEKTEIDEIREAIPVPMTPKPVKPRMATWKVVLISILAVCGIMFLIILGIGMAYTPTQDTNKPYIPPYTPPTTPPTSYDDAEFIQWITSNTQSMLPFFSDVQSAASNYDYSELVRLAIQYQYRIEGYLDDIAHFKLSTPYEELRREYTAFLQDTKVSCQYLESGASDMDADDIRTATSYITAATEHVTQCTRLINELKG